MYRVLAGEAGAVELSGSEDDCELVEKWLCMKELHITDECANTF